MTLASMPHPEIPLETRLSNRTFRRYSANSIRGSGSMSLFEYSVIPSPRTGKKAKGVKGAEAKFANALSSLMNDMGSDGWEYVRADTLPCEERQGLTGKTVKYHSMLIFRRPVEEVAEESKAAAETLAAPELAPQPEPVAAKEQRTEPPISLDSPSSEPFGLPKTDPRDKTVAAE